VGLAPTGKAPPCHGARGKPTFGFPDGTPIDTHGIDESMLSCFCCFGLTGVATL